MKGSEVLKGLKSWASALHPQLPLSRKESQRLLTALTSSFRQHLDQAHPRQAGGDEARPTPQPSSGVTHGIEKLHTSSAALADRHLASVLTSPLLAKTGATKAPALTVESAKIELRKENYAKDPVALLEHYHEKGAATVSIAALCLQSFEQHIAKLPKQDRQASIASTNAGKRVLNWLRLSGLYQSDAFVDDKILMDSLALFLIREGAEHFLWDWLRMDLTLGHQFHWAHNDSRQDHQNYKYRWKGRLTRAIVMAKLTLSKNASADDALDAYFKAYDLKKASANPNVATSRQSKPPAAIQLEKALTRFPTRYPKTDPLKFDKFIHHLELTITNDDSIFEKQQIAHLWLAHPKRPSPLPALKFLQEVFTTPHPSDAMLRQRIMSPMSESYKDFAQHVMLRTAAQLQCLARSEDAEWILSLARRLYPDDVPLFETKLRKYRAAFPLAKVQVEQKLTVPSEPMPYPSIIRRVSFV